MLKTEHFYYMIEISKAGTINRAADNLYISQPYLSVCLKEMEAYLDVKLFVRNNRGVILTEAGKQFLEYCHEIVSLINKSKALKNHTSPEPSLSISSMYSFTMLDLFNNFSANDIYKHAKITYEEIPNGFIFDKVEQGESDIGIVFTTSNELNNFKRQMLERGLNFYRLVDEPLYAVLNTNHILSNKESVSFKELQQFDYIVEKTKHPYKNISIENNPFPDIFKTSNRQSIVFDNNRSLMYYLTRNNNSYTVGQKALNLTNPFVQSGQLKYIPISDLNVSMMTGYIVNEHIESSDIQQAFLDYLNGFFYDYYNKNYKTT